MNVMVCGSREWHSSWRVVNRFDALPPDTVILHGGAEGADAMAQHAADVYGLRTEVFLPDTSRPSPQRYHERNDAMLDRADLVLAFWDGASRGTKSVIAKARKRGIPVEVLR